MADNNLTTQSFDRESKVAKAKIDSVIKSLRTLQSSLSKIRGYISTIIKADEDCRPIIVEKLATEQEPTTVQEPTTEQEPTIKKEASEPAYCKNRNETLENAKVIFFKKLGLIFYVDFTIQCDHNEGLAGLVIYGVSNFDEKGKVIDNPLFTYSVDDRDIINASDISEEGLADDKDFIQSIHSIVLSKIWPEALAVVNKIKLGKY